MHCCNNVTRMHACVRLQQCNTHACMHVCGCYNGTRMHACVRLLQCYTHACMRAAATMLHACMHVCGCYFIPGRWKPNSATLKTKKGAEVLVRGGFWAGFWGPRSFACSSLDEGGVLFEARSVMLVGGREKCNVGWRKCAVAFE